MDSLKEVIKEELQSDDIKIKSKTSKLIDTLRWDMYMLPCKICYFFTSGKEGAILPYIIPFLIGIGLTPAEAGLISGLRLIGMILGGTFWGYIGDKYQNHKHIMLILVLASILLIGGQPFLSIKIGDPDRNVCPARTINIISGNGTIETTNTSSDKVTYVSNRFFILLFLNIVASFFDGNCVSMGDTGVLQRIYATSSKKDFGWNRFFGAVGFSVGSFLSGFASDLFPKININCFTGAICCYVCFCIGILISSRFLYLENSKLKISHKKDVELQQVKIDIKKKLFKTLKSVEVSMFFATVFIIGFLQGIYAGFTALRLKELDATPILIGLTFSIAAISCFPFLIFSHKVISLLGGEWNAIIVCSFSYVIRYLAFAFIKNPWLSIPINVLHSIGFGLAIVTFVLYVKELSEPCISTTMISIMNGTFFGIGYIVANIVGGQIIYSYNGTTLFASCGILAGVWTLVLILFNSYQKMFKSNKMPVESPNNRTDISLIKHKS